MDLKKEKTAIIAGGAVIGVIASMLVFFGNPANMGFCIACFIGLRRFSISAPSLSALFSAVSCSPSQRRSSHLAADPRLSPASC